MTFLLRPYQSAATDKTLEFLRQSVDPVLIDAAPAAGKSYMIAKLAAELHKMSGGKRVLCLAPSRELVTQNHQKYLLTGEPASIFSASAGAKSTRHVVVFGTPKTVANSISRFTRTGKDGFCAVIVDECHGMTPTIRAIIDEMRQANPNLRVVGLTGTPFALNKGYIFRVWHDGRVNDDDVTRDPYFTQLAYRVSAREMLDEGFITPMVVGEINSEAYDTSGIELMPNGTFNHATVERAFEGHGRRTAGAIADALCQARNRPGGVMYFAATVRHGQEVMASLPVENSAFVSGDDCTLFGKPATRKQVIEAYRARRVRHLTSIGTLTTGFDVEHTETIVLLRFTESASLLTQILGRAWRLCEGKADCLLLDYAGNVAKHFGDTADIYNPVIKAKGAKGAGIPIDAECPDCGYINEFSLQPDYADFQRDKHGYCLDVFGSPLMSEYGPVAAHYGRRCLGLVRSGARGEYERCGHFWTSKECEACQHPNDIAARFCSACKNELVNPNDRLVAEFVAAKRDPTQIQTERVLSYETKESVSQKGNATLRIDFVTPYRQFSTWLLREPKNAKQAADLARWEACEGDPKTVSYLREEGSNFWRVLAYGCEPDDEELPAELAGRKEIAKLRRHAA